MNTQRYPSCSRLSFVLMPVVVVFCSGYLLGCKPQPKSLFEQQAETVSANEIQASDIEISDERALVTDAKLITSENASTAPIQIIKQKAVARQPNCDSNLKSCQYFELNILDFSPKQPWLTSIMWQTIVRVIAPEVPLVSQDETAKKAVLMLLNQIEYGDTVARSLPMYQRIETEVVFNPIDPDATQSTATGYLAVRSSQQRSSDRQHLNYVMLDMQKKLQLTIEDVLLPEVEVSELLMRFQNAKKEWLILQGVEAQYLEDWPLHISKEWYLSEQGLHMVYQSGELLKSNTDAVDLIVPYLLLEDLIKPNYIVGSY